MGATHKQTQLQHIRNNLMTGSEKFLTVPEVAAKYRYTDETVWKKCRQYSEGFPQGWPHHRDGRTIRFSAADLEAIDKKMNPAPAAPAGKRKRKPLAA